MARSPAHPRRHHADPLAGKRVVVTRAAEQAEELCAALEARGAQAIRCPTIRLAPPDDWVAVDAALGRIDSYDWVVFTSPNGVRFTLHRMVALGLDASVLRETRVASVGPRTARELADRGVEADFVAADEGSTPLAKSLPAVEGAAILLARSDRADPVAGEILRGRGARNVDEVVAYRTAPEVPSGAQLEALAGGIDAITYTSPSTVYGFLALAPEWRLAAADAIVACLGPTTTAAAREAGLVVYEATEKTMAGLVEALATGFAARAERPGGPLRAEETGR